MVISELFSLPEEDKKVIFESILQQANKEQRKMVINQEYIQQHLNRLNGIKLRALDINNFLSEVDTGYEDQRLFEWCNIVADHLEIEIKYGAVGLSYKDPYDSYDDRSWSVPLQLFDMSNEELVEYIKEKAAEQFELGKKVEYAELHRNAKKLGYRLVPIENTGE